MSFVSQSLAVAGGAALGANLRYWLGYWIVGARHSVFPWHTLLINVTGSLALGIVMAYALGRGWSEGWRLFAAVGVCGGYTTFSTYSAEVITLFEEGQPYLAIAYALGSNFASVMACFAGVHFTRTLLMA